MRQQESYTQEEIESKINILYTDVENLIRDRKSINSKVLEKRKQIKYWSEMSTNQYKMFD